MKAEITESNHTILPDGSAFFVASISIPWWKNFLKKIKMADWWLRRPRYNCPKCGKGLYTYWDGNDTNEGINFCNKCAKKVEQKFNKDES